ncbi:MAG: hypothetical protein ABIS68_04260 [Casimicrobiaceae bacterium]
MPSPAELFGIIVFGVIGSVALMYGKRMAQWKTMVVGGAMVVYPYFTSQTWQLYGIGAALCAALYFFRD